MSTIKAYGLSHDLLDFDEVRTYEIRGVCFTIYRLPHQRNYNWAVTYKGDILDSGHDTGDIETPEDAFEDMANSTKDAEEYVAIYEERRKRGERFAAYFAEHGTIPTGMSALDEILGGDDE